MTITLPTGHQCYEYPYTKNNDGSTTVKLELAKNSDRYPILTVRKADGTRYEIHLQPGNKFSIKELNSPKTKLPPTRQTTPVLPNASTTTPTTEATATAPITNTTNFAKQNPTTTPPTNPTTTPASKSADGTKTTTTPTSPESTTNTIPPATPVSDTPTSPATESPTTVDDKSEANIESEDAKPQTTMLSPLVRLVGFIKEKLSDASTQTSTPGTTSGASESNGLETNQCRIVSVTHDEPNPHPDFRSITSTMQLKGEQPPTPEDAKELYDLMDKKYIRENFTEEVFRGMILDGKIISADVTSTPKDNPAMVLLAGTTEIKSELTLRFDRAQNAIIMTNKAITKSKSPNELSQAYKNMLDKYVIPEIFTNQEYDKNGLNKKYNDDYILYSMAYTVKKAVTENGAKQNGSKGASASELDFAAIPAGNATISKSYRQKVSYGPLGRRYVTREPHPDTVITIPFDKPLAATDMNIDILHGHVLNNLGATEQQVQGLLSENSKAFTISQTRGERGPLGVMRYATTHHIVSLSQDKTKLLITNHVPDQRDPWVQIAKNQGMIHEKMNKEINTNVAKANTFITEMSNGGTGYKVASK